MKRKGLRREKAYLGKGAFKSSLRRRPRVQASGIFWFDSALLRVDILRLMRFPLHLPPSFQSTVAEPRKWNEVLPLLIVGFYGQRFILNSDWFESLTGQTPTNGFYWTSSRLSVSTKDAVEFGLNTSTARYLYWVEWLLCWSEFPGNFYLIVYSFMKLPNFELHCSSLRGVDRIIYTHTVNGKPQSR